MSTTIAKGNSIMDFMKYGPVSLHQPMSREEFIILSSKFPDLRMEREKNGIVTVMMPVKKGSGKNEITVSGYLFMWHLKNRLGEIYSPSTGIELPDGAIKSPDAAWISAERLASLPENSDEEFLKIVPDFVVEIRSSTDRISALKKKMTDNWMKNGARLGWLIDPYSEKVWIYREGQEVELVKGFDDTILTGEDLMPGMELPMKELKLKKPKK